MILKVIDKKKESEDAFSLILEKPKNFSYYPGQYLDIELPVNDPLGNTRAFTISSSPTENYLMITPKKGVSKFKKKLESLKTGDSITCSHPAGTFTLDELSPAVFIAGGIGVTPFRSMIKYAVDQRLSISITLVYSSSDGSYLFKEELILWQKTYPKLSITYHHTENSGHLYLDSKFRIFDSIYYLAGPPKMVNSTEKMLLKLGVDAINIRYDRFDGYL